MDTTTIRKLNIRLIAIISCALIIALSVIIVVSLHLAKQYVVPEMEAKAVTQGQALTNLIARPLAYDIALPELVGIKDLFEDALQENPEYGFLAITDVQGRLLFRLGDPLTDVEKHISSPALVLSTAKIVENGARPKAVNLGKHHVVTLPIFSRERAAAGLLHIGIKSSYVQNILNELLLDLAVILIVSLFLAYEALYFISGGKLSGQYEALCRVLAATARNDFTQRVAHVGRDELGRVTTMVDMAILKINERYGRLVARARETGLLKNGAGSDAAPGSPAAVGLQQDISFGSSSERSPADTSHLSLLRAPLFLSLISEELSRAFIPLYAQQLYAPIPGFSEKFILGLPIMMFMMLVALLQPVLANWSERVGRKHSLLTGVLIGCVAFVMTANAFTLYDLLLWRALSGVSWAIVFVASQGFILDKATTETRTRDIAFFVSVIMVASLCGPPIGGILADTAGFRATFYVSAGLSLLSAAFMLRYLPNDPFTPAATPRKLRMQEIMAVLANRKFLMLVLTAAMPAKMILVGFCFYLMPLYITHIGGGAAMAGRVLMIYAVMMIIGVPVAARISDRLGKRKEFVGVGLLLSGIAGFIVLLGSNIYTAIGVVLVLGLAQAISIAPQTAFVYDICADDISRLGEGTVYGVYRLMERIGNTLGPLLAALVFTYFGFKGAFSIIGLLLVAGGATFILVFRRSAAHLPGSADSKGLH